MAAPASLLRLQVSASFDLFAAADLCEYAHDLGIGALYLSPLLASVRSSAHGYDVVDFERIDPARGGEDGWRTLLEATRAHDLDLVVDIVPNHAGVGDASQNAAWWDVLRRGKSSPYARWFDIDWAAGRLTLPVLAAHVDLERDLTIDGDELRCGVQRFPIAPGTGPRPGESAARVHDRQHYRLVSGAADPSYRRFFTVNALAGLRVEDEAVFAATHAEVLRWVDDDGVAGLRIDHPDGLADPFGYLRRLRAAAPSAWIVVEKILAPEEVLPPRWPVEGTTGYDALAEVSGLLADPSSEAGLDAAYRALTGDERSFAEHAHECRRLFATTSLHGEVSRLAALVPEVRLAESALVELLAAFAVHRTYLPDGVSYLDAALSAARTTRPDLAAALDAIARGLRDPSSELCVRFQQTSAAVTAKGVEDTAYYRYTRFVAANEVGGDPSRIGRSIEEFHVLQARRLQSAPYGLTTLATHDTKRGEDVRARMYVLAEMIGTWRALAGDLMERAPVPNAAMGYLLWQTLAGTGFIERPRMHAYIEKAMREAADGTSWWVPDVTFEAAVHAAVDSAYESPELRVPLSRFIEQITPYGWTNSLSQKLIQLTMPGVPDLYQGDELWDDSLVDPDNRRAVDFARRRLLLRSLTEPPPVDASGVAKLWVVSRALRARRDRPELFCDYLPLYARGGAAEHAVAFDRGGAITVATRLPARLAARGGWDDTTLQLDRSRTDALTGRLFSGTVALAELLEAFPVALLLP